MGSDPAKNDLREAVVQYAQGHNGQKVGDGSCWDLAEKALSAAKAKGSNDYGKVTPTSDYIWGELISLKDAQPGDILQFKDHLAKVIKTKKVKIVFLNMNSSKHTIILEATTRRSSLRTPATA